MANVPAIAVPSEMSSINTDLLLAASTPDPAGETLQGDQGEEQLDPGPGQQ